VDERFLITGALGCVGAWTARTLVQEGVPVVAFDLGADPKRLRLIMDEDELGRVTFVRGDVTDRATVGRALDEHGITHVIHLAALLIPLAKADPPHGALVNVVGTVNVFEEVKRRRGRVRGLAYASSIGAFGDADARDGAPVPADAIGRPNTHYGVHKQANEGAARVYWLDDGVGSVGLRPYIVYGPGRDTGLTAAPTLAMAAAASGEPYHIPFGGRTQLQYAPDVARAFLLACRASADGARVFNLGGSAVHMREVVSSIEEAAPAARGRISFADEPLPFPPEFEAESLQRALGPIGWTPLAHGVGETIEHFRSRARAESSGGF
jgi:UDP-glucuronate 4-epimerase